MAKHNAHNELFNGDRYASRKDVAVGDDCLFFRLSIEAEDGLEGGA